MTNQSEMKNCNLCGVKILNTTFTKFNGICAQCNATSEREEFLLKGGMPEDRYSIELIFKLPKSIISRYYNIDDKQYLRVSLISRGPNDYLAGNFAQEIVSRKLQSLIPELLDKDISYTTNAIEVERNTNLTEYKNIDFSSFELFQNKPIKNDIRVSSSDISDYEDLLVDVTKNSITDFLNDNIGKVFYAFGFDCMSDCGAVQLATNTENAFTKKSKMYIDKWNYKEKDLIELKESFGDWDYQGFNHNYNYWKKCRYYEDKIDKFVLDRNTSSEASETLSSDLMNMFTRALLRIEQSEEFKNIPKEPGFYIQILDHDENPRTSVERLNRIRNKMNQTT